MNFCNGHGRCIAQSACQCDYNYHGTTCEYSKQWGVVHPASSCSHVYAYNTSALSGIYALDIPLVGPKNYYCSFPGGWTLIESFKRSINNAPTNVNDPKNPTTPNFDDYRVSLTEMQQIHALSSEWSATCNANMSFIDNYILSNIADGIFFETGWGVCMKFKSISIRGNRADNHYVRFWNNGGFSIHFHIDSSAQTCVETPAYRPVGSLDNEDNFGVCSRIC